MPTIYLVHRKPQTGLPTTHGRFETLEAAEAHMRGLVDARLTSGDWILVPSPETYDADPRQVLLQRRDKAVESYFISVHRADAGRGAETPDPASTGEPDRGRRRFKLERHPG